MGIKIVRLAWCLVVAIPLNIIYLIVSLVPKDKNVWIFGAWNGKKFLDNPKHLYLHVLENESAIRPMWITKDKQLAVELSRKKLPAAYVWSLRGVLAQCRASVAIFTHSIEWEFAPYLIGKSTKRVQTWHGIPIKKIGYDDEKDAHAKVKARLISLVMPYRNDRCDIVLAASEVDKEKYKSAFNVDEHNIVISGYPRNDALMRSANMFADTVSRRIIYMPTLRGRAGSEFTLFKDTQFNFSQIDLLLERNDLELYIKLHPVQRFMEADIQQIATCRNIKVITNDGDIYESIGNFDVLITDFSGIYFDFLITGKPIIMAPFEMETYLARDRSLYFDYHDICPERTLDSWDDIIDAAVRHLSDNEVNPRYAALRSKFHRYVDACASERVTREIHLMLSQSREGGSRLGPRNRL